MLEAIFAKLGGVVLDRIFGGIVDIAKQVINKQITEIEARKQMGMLFMTAFKEIEVSHAQVLAETYKTFWSAASDDKSNIMKVMWAAALGSQIFVLFWSQWCVPLAFAYGWLPSWKAGTTAEWSYLLIAGLLGMGPTVLRSGPAAGNAGGIVGMLKTLVGIR